MSYSFGVRAASKAVALAQVVAELAKVVLGQPVHIRDQQQAEAAASCMLAVLPDPSAEQDVVVSVSGSLGWRGVYPGEDFALVSASVNVSCSLQAKQTA